PFCPNHRTAARAFPKPRLTVVGGMGHDCRALAPSPSASFPDSPEAIGARPPRTFFARAGSRRAVKVPEDMMGTSAHLWRGRPPAIFAARPPPYRAASVVRSSH